MDIICSRSLFVTEEGSSVAWSATPVEDIDLSRAKISCQVESYKKKTPSAISVAEDALLLYSSMCAFLDKFTAIFSQNCPMCSLPQPSASFLVLC